MAHQAGADVTLAAAVALQQTHRDKRPKLLEHSCLRVGQSADGSGGVSVVEDDGGGGLVLEGEVHFGLGAERREHLVGLFEGQLGPVTLPAQVHEQEVFGCGGGTFEEFP